MSGSYDEIRISGLEIYAHHGVYDSEKKRGQKFVLNLSLFLDARQAGRTDDLTKTVNYGAVCRDLDLWMREKNYDLLEAVALNLSKRILWNYPAVHHLRFEIGKPDAPIDLPFETVSVRMEVGWHRVCLSIGSNMGDREKYLREALEQFRLCREIRNLKVSSLIETKPYGGVEQEDFLNGAVCLETLFTPRELLDYLHEVENAAGRTREIHWGPRTLDLDILFYDKVVCEEDGLVLPHVDLEHREFVLKPLCEIAPDYRHPVLGKTMKQLLRELTGEEA